MAVKRGAFDHVTMSIFKGTSFATIVPPTAAEPDSEPIVSEADVAIWAEDNTPIVTE